MVSAAIKSFVQIGRAILPAENEQFARLSLPLPNKIEFLIQALLSCALIVERSAKTQQLIIILPHREHGFSAVFPCLRFKRPSYPAREAFELLRDLPKKASRRAFSSRVLMQNPSVDRKERRLLN